MLICIVPKDPPNSKGHGFSPHFGFHHATAATNCTWSVTLRDAGWGIVTRVTETQKPMTNFHPIATCIKKAGGFSMIKQQMNQNQPIPYQISSNIIQYQYLDSRYIYIVSNNPHIMKPTVTESGFATRLAFAGRMTPPAWNTWNQAFHAMHISEFSATCDLHLGLCLKWVCHFVDAIFPLSWSD